MLDIREQQSVQPQTPLVDPPLRNSLNYPRMSQGAELPTGALLRQENLNDLPNPATARNNLGLGTLALLTHTNIYENFTFTHENPLLTTNENKPLLLFPHGAGFVVIGADPTSNHNLSNGNDLLVNGVLEVQDILYTEKEIRTKGSVIIGEPGQGLQIKNGTADCTMGRAVLSGGSVVVSNNLVTANTQIFLTIQVPGGTPGAVYVSARSANTSFTITSTSGTDSSTVAYLLVEPI